VLEPMEEIAEVRDQARAAGDPLADLVALVTVDAEGLPSARMVVMRGLSRQGIEVMVSALSPKVRDLEATGRYQLLLYWRSVQRQFRLRGSYRVLSAPAREPIWARKRHESKLLDHYYERFQEQSSVLASREALLEGIEALRTRYPDPAEVPIPEATRLIRFEPAEVELWAGSDEDRLHRRWRAKSEGEGWSRELLVP